MTVTRRIYVTDCEGPLTRNDNAQEIAAEFIPDGAELFARLSRYDDFLADVLHKPHYNAGDTLRLLPPFLKAFEVRDDDVVDFSAANVLVVPGAPELLAELQRLLPCYIISTSYTPYIRALCDVIGFPFANCHCTTLSLDAWQLPAREKGLLRTWARRIVERPIIEIPDGAASADDLTDQDRETVRMLDHLFWGLMCGEIEGTGPGDERLPAAGELLAAVRPVGGGMKLAALEEIVAAEGVGTDQVMYVGDSITDAPPLAAVRSWGGIALSFNGNGYALAAAEVAAAGTSVAPVLGLARAFAAGGPQAVRELAGTWPPEPASADGVPLALAGLLEHDRATLTAASLAARSAVRGEHIARLG